MQLIPASSTSSFYQRLRYRLIAGYLLVAGILCGAAGWYVIHDRAEHLKEARHNAETLVRALEEHVRRAFNAIDVLLNVNAAEILAQGGVRKLNEEQRHNILKEKLRLVPQSNSLFIYGPDLFIYAGSGKYPLPRVDGNQYGHVNIHRSPESTTLHVGKPLISPVRNSWTIPVTRRITGPDGSLWGVVGAIMDQEHFYQFYRDLNLAQDSGIALIRTDGIMLFRFPETPQLKPGVDLQGTPPMFSGQPLHLQATHRFVSELDHVERILTYRQIPELGLLVVIATEVNKILAPWQQNAMAIGIGLAAALLALLALLLITLRQITRRAEDEARLAEAETQYRNLVEITPVGIARYAHQQIEYANPEMLRILGVATLGEVGDRSLLEFVHADDLDRCRDQLAALETAPGGSNLQQFRMRHADATELLVELQAVSLLQDGALHVHIMMRDITVEQMALEEVHRLNETLEQKVRDRTAELKLANQELEAFSYSVSHDLRSPLRAITGFADVLRNDYAREFSAEATALLNRIDNAARRMSELIEAMLSLARVSRQELRPSAVDLSALVKDVVNELIQGERQVAVSIAPGMMAHADAILLRVVLQNLLGNAYKYTLNTTQPRIEIGESSAGGEPHFFVRDNGAGFDMQYSARLFRPFQRLHSEREFQGMGIGLATVERIIRRHGGRIWVEAAPTQGATFRFIFPDTR